MDKEKKRESARDKRRGKCVPETITVDDSTLDDTPARNPVLGIAYKSPLNWSWKNSSLSLIPIAGSQSGSSVFEKNVIETVDLSDSPAGTDMPTPKTSKINRPKNTFQTQSHFSDVPGSSTNATNIPSDVICNVRIQEDSHAGAASTRTRSKVADSEAPVPVADIQCVDLVNTPVSDKSGSVSGLSIIGSERLQVADMVKPFVNVNMPTGSLKATSNEKLHEIISDALNNDFKTVDPVPDQSMDVTLPSDSVALKTESSVDHLTSTVDMLTLLNETTEDTRNKRRNKKRPRESSSSLHETEDKKHKVLSKRAKKRKKKNESNASAALQASNISEKTPHVTTSVTKVTFDAGSKNLSVNLTQPVPIAKVVPKDYVVRVTDDERVVSTNLNETIVIDDEDVSVVHVNSTAPSPPVNRGNNFVVTIQDDDRTVNRPRVSSSKVSNANDIICLDDQDSADEITVLLDACPQVEKSKSEDVIILRSKKKNRKTKDEATYIARLRKAHKVALFESQKMEKLLLESGQKLGLDMNRATSISVGAPTTSYIPYNRNQRDFPRSGKHHEPPARYGHRQFADSRPMAENRTRDADRTRWEPRFPNLFGCSNPAVAACDLPQAYGPSGRLPVPNHEPRNRDAPVEHPPSPATPNLYGNNFSNPDKNVPRKGLRPVIIDGCNVAIGHGSNGSTFSSRGLEICVRFFLKKGHKVYAFVPLFRRSSAQTTDSHILDRLEREKHLVFTPSRFVDGRSEVPYDDRYIVQTAAELGGVIVSKDNYRDLLAENPHYSDTIKNRLLMFTWVGDMIMFPQDPLGRDGPTLDKFLRFN